MEKPEYCSLLPWLPGPVLTVEHRALAVRRTADDLINRAGRRARHRPETWVWVAEGLGLVCVAYHAPGKSAGRLSYDPVEDRWIIFWNTARHPVLQAATLAHELAHYYFRMARGEWICGEAVVYYYEGSVNEEHHKLAEDVDWLVVPRWESVPAIGLFADFEGEIELLEIERSAFQ